MNETETSKTKKNTGIKIPSIELMRILACLLVISAHCQLYAFENNEINAGRLFYSSIISDDVPIFFLITGFFFFKDVKDDNGVFSIYIKKLRSFLINIWIPTVLFYLIYSIFEFSKGNNIWNSFFNLTIRFNGPDHLWYVTALLQFSILFPLFAFICQDDKNRNNLRRIIILFSIVGSIISDIQVGMNAEYLDKDKAFGLPYYYIYLLLGYELSLYLSKQHKASFILCLGVLLYIFGTSVKYGMQYFITARYGIYPSKFIWLQSTPCLITSTGFFIAVFSLNVLLTKNEIITIVVNWIGKKTFYIYLFHYYVLYATSEIRYKIIENNHGCTKLIDIILYYIESSIITFMISLIFALLFTLIYDVFIKKALNKLFIVKVKK